MRDGKGFDTKNWHVYTLIGFTDQAEVDKSTGKFTGKMQYTPIYGLVSKKGYKHRGHTIVEYGRETQFDFNKENEWDYREALNNPLALADMASEFDKVEWNKISNSIHLITSLPSYSDMNYAISEQDRVYMDDSEVFEEDEVTGEVLEEKEELVIDPINTNSYQNVNENKTYSGMIDKLNSNQIFVFGSNTQGRHGKGAALTARNKFGAIYGQAEGLQGQSYAIITKDLTKTTHPSRTKEQIIE
mgnify:FL=1